MQQGLKRKIIIKKHGCTDRGHDVMDVSLEKVGFYCWCCVVVQSVSGDEKITTT